MEKVLTRFGVGLRPPHFTYLEKNPKLAVDWFEAVSENYMDTRGRPYEILKLIRKKYPVALHGVGMSIASSEGPNESYLNQLNALIRDINPFLVSDHLCWTRFENHETHDLLPFPFTEKNIQLCVQNIDRVQTTLKRTIALENVSSYLTFKSSEMQEWEFINEVIKRSGAYLLLDVNNVYVNAQNHQFDPRTFIDGISHDRVKQIHLAGHTDMGDYLFDTHSKPVSEDVWDLYAYCAKKLPPQTATLIEWDEDIPEFTRLEAEAMKAKQIWSEALGLEINGSTQIAASL